MLQKQKANHAVAERKKWKKFGQAATLSASFDEGITVLAEAVTLKLGSGDAVRTHLLLN